MYSLQSEEKTGQYHTEKGTSNKPIERITDENLMARSYRKTPAAPKTTVCIEPFLSKEFSLTSFHFHFFLFSLSLQKL
jgi:hypothetical protein